MSDRGTISRALAVIRILSRSSEPVRVKTIAVALNLPMSTTHRYLDLMVESGFIQKDKHHRYFVGAELLMIAKTIMEKPSLLSTAPPVLEEVNSRTREAAVLNVYCRWYKTVSYVAASRCEQKPFWTLAYDRQNPLAKGASGLAMLAFLPRRLQDRIIRLTEGSPTTAAGARVPPIVERLNEVRAKGYAVTQEEAIEGAAGVAVPVIYRGEVVGSMGLIIPMSRFQQRMCDAYARVLKGAARRAVAVADAGLH